MEQKMKTKPINPLELTYFFAKIHDEIEKTPKPANLPITTLADLNMYTIDYINDHQLEYLVFNPIYKIGPTLQRMIAHETFTDRLTIKPFRSYLMILIRSKPYVTPATTYIINLYNFYGDILYSTLK
jgi:hypothetical protein